MRAGLAMVARRWIAASVILISLLAAMPTQAVAKSAGKGLRRIRWQASIGS